MVGVDVANPGLILLPCDQSSLGSDPAGYASVLLLRLKA